MAMMHKYFIIFKTILKTSATDIILLINCDELLDKLLIFVDRNYEKGLSD